MPKTNRKRYPLRKITGHLYYPPSNMGWFAQKKVSLECGHTAWCSTATAYRARCRECFQCGDQEKDR